MTQKLFRHRRGDLLRPHGLTQPRRCIAWRWVAWSLAIVFTPAVVMGAYQPSFLLGANNLSDLASAATAWTNLGGGTAGKKAASDNTKATVASVNGATVVGHMGTFADTAGTVQDGGLANPSTTVTIYTSNTASVTLANTNNLTEAIAQGTPAALTINLNATGLSAGFTQCVKDKANTFATNNATVKTTDSSTIDGAAGATGFTMNQNKQGNCFVFDGATNWLIM
jgi:hypothetical protein